MARDKRNGGAAVEDTPVVETPATPTVVANHVLTYRREHPGNRCSYGIAGNSGIVVFDKGLFAGSTEAGFQAPATITLSCEMVPVKADTKVAREAAAAQKLIERAAKAQAKIEAAAAKALERQAKADEALAKARAKVEAASAAAQQTA